MTSKSWALFDGSSGKFIDGKCVHNQREVASLTKIMTCYTVLNFFEELIHKDMTKVIVKVSSRAAAMTGIHYFLSDLEFNLILCFDFPLVSFVSFGIHLIILTGTSARLRSNMMISIWDLLFGLMLPSGNDSAFCLAETVGSLMYIYTKGNEEVLSDSIMYDASKLSELLD